MKKSILATIVFCIFSFNFSANAANCYKNLFESKPNKNWFVPKRGNLPKNSVEVVDANGVVYLGKFVGKISHDQGRIDDARIRKEIRGWTGKPFQKVRYIAKTYDLLTLFSMPKSKLNASQKAAIKKYMRNVDYSEGFLRSIIQSYREDNINPTSISVKYLKLVVEGKEYYMRASQHDDKTMSYIAKLLGMNGKIVSNGPAVVSHAPGKRGHVYEGPDLKAPVYPENGLRFDWSEAKNGPAIRIIELESYAYEKFYIDFQIYRPENI